jgi:hypothetical protein
MNENKPFWNEKNRRYARILAWALVVLAVLGADMLGLRLPIPDPPLDDAVLVIDSVLEDDTTFTTLATTGNASIGGALSVTGASTFAGLVDVNGLADGLVLDTDGDTTLSADTDDTINVEVSGADDFVITANTFTASSGSSIVLASGAYPLGFATSGSQLVFGTDDITGTATAAHGLTTVTFAVCTLGEDPTAGAGEGAMCTVTVSGNVVTLKVWQDDFVTAASETDVAVHWIVVGVP